MSSGRKRAMIAALALVASSLHARENAVLRSGFTVLDDHHRQLGATTRLFLSAAEDEYVDVETDKIVSFEPDDAPAPASVVAPSFTDSSQDLNQIVANAARENHLDSDFIHALIRAESHGNRQAVSAKGAQGLMQLMPETAARMGVKNSFDANENVIAGTRYLRELLARYHNDPVRALAAYNAGPGRLERYHGVPPYGETRAYVANIIREFNRRKRHEERQARTLKKPAPAVAGNRSRDGN